MVPAFRSLARKVLLSLIVLLIAPVPASAQEEGDIAPVVGWTASIDCTCYPTPVDFAIAMWMWEGGTSLATDYREGQDHVTADIHAVVHARSGSTDRTVEGVAAFYYRNGMYWEQLDQVSESVTVPGAGPGSFTLKISAFIPWSYMQAPLPFDDQTVLMEGDDRGFSYYGGTSRLSQIYDLFNPGVNDSLVLGGPWSDVGLSAIYEAATSLDGDHLSQAAKDDWEAGFPMKILWGFADTGGMACEYPQRMGQVNGPFTSTLFVACHASASFPFLAVAPGIDWEYQLVTVFGDHGFDYELTGCHDGFPNHEVYINGVGILQDTHETPLSLFPPCEGIAPRSGRIQ